MKLSAPLSQLKSLAKKIKKKRNISLSAALDIVAQVEGYSSWSLLRGKQKLFLPRTQTEILEYLNPGDLMIIGARPGIGKTKFALSLLVLALNQGRHCFLFSFEFTRTNVTKRIDSLIRNIDDTRLLTVDLSDDISASHIVNKTTNSISRGAVIVVDYLQLLDQKRSNPEVQEQIQVLKLYAKQQGCIIIFISQLDRSSDENEKAIPSINDVRMPNEFDINLFNKIMLIYKDRKVFLKPVQFEIEP
jgi:replicative DNA helicase